MVSLKSQRRRPANSADYMEVREYCWSCNYIASLFLFPWPRHVSRDVPGDAGFQCDKAAVWWGGGGPLLRKWDPEIKNLKWKLHSKLYWWSFRCSDELKIVTMFVVLLKLPARKNEDLITESCTERFMVIQNTSVCRVSVVLWKQNC